MKISAIQANTGSQYLRNRRKLSTANQNRIRARGNQNMIGFAKRRRIWHRKTLQ